LLKMGVAEVITFLEGHNGWADSETVAASLGVSINNANRNLRRACKRDEVERRAQIMGYKRAFKFEYKYKR